MRVDNEMEGHLASTGVVIAKFWLQIDRDEQPGASRAAGTTPNEAGS